MIICCSYNGFSQSTQGTIVDAPLDNSYTDNGVQPTFDNESQNTDSNPELYDGVIYEEVLIDDGSLDEENSVPGSTSGGITIVGDNSFNNPDPIVIEPVIPVTPIDTIITSQIPSPVEDSGSRSLQELNANVHFLFQEVELIKSNMDNQQESILKLQNLEAQIISLRSEVENYRALTPSYESPSSSNSTLSWILYGAMIIGLTALIISSFILYKGGYIVALFDPSKHNHDLQKVIQAKKFVATMRNRGFSDGDIEKELIHFGYDEVIITAALKKAENIKPHFLNIFNHND